MVQNTVAYNELKTILQSMLNLENTTAIKSIIYPILRFTKFKATDEKQFVINSKTTGVISIYNGFEIEIRRLNDPKNGYSGVSVIHFKRKKRFIDPFRNPTGKLVRTLIKLCEFERPNIELTKFKPSGLSDIHREEFYIQRDALNPYWEKDNKLSPITIFVSQTSSDYLIEFLFTPECYERAEQKTTLREDWINILTLFTPNL